MRRTRAALASAITVAVCAAVLSAAPSSAAEATYEDPADTTASLTDIRTVEIAHSPDKLRVIVGFTDLRRHSEGGAAGLTIFLDTTKDRRGAEFGLTTGLQDGTDYQLLRIRRGDPVGEPLACPHRVRLGFAKDRLSFDAARTCFDAPARVRVGVKMRDDADPSHPVVDWLGEPRSWTRWVRSS